MDPNNPTDCIKNYDELLSQMPDWQIGYYNRGICKRLAAGRTNQLAIYFLNLQDAIKDQDKAIILDPTYGNAYVERAFDYMNLQETVHNSTDLHALLTISLQNLDTGLKLGTRNPDAQFNRAVLLEGLGRCQEGLDEANRVMEATGRKDGVMFRVLAIGHLCLGNYEKALEFTNQSLKVEDHTETYRLQTSALIGLGRLDEAFDVVTQSIQRNPDYTGYRYFQRALLYYERGEYDLAREDLDTGVRNTWYTAALQPYVHGLLALHDNNQASGIELLQFSLSNLHVDEGLWLEERLRADLNRLEAPFQTPTPSNHWNVTPIPGQE